LLRPLEWTGNPLGRDVVHGRLANCLGVFAELIFPALAVLLDAIGDDGAAR